MLVKHYLVRNELFLGLVAYNLLRGPVWGRPEVYPTIKGSRDAARQAWMETLKAKS
jgi:hypothetical protein